MPEAIARVMGCWALLLFSAAAIPVAAHQEWACI